MNVPCYSPDPDRGGDEAYDRHVALVDAGERCPECYSERDIKRGSACGIPLFTCRCGCEFFDFVTQRTAE